jgi:hypothetical protein
MVTQERAHTSPIWGTPQSSPVTERGVASPGAPLSVRGG